MKKISVLAILIISLGFNYFYNSKDIEGSVSTSKEIKNVNLEVKSIVADKAKIIKEDKGEEREVIYDETKKITEALKLSKKVLLTKKERRVYQDRLKDEKLILFAKKEILHSEEYSSEAELIKRENKRMDNVLFLMRSMQWRENPSKRFVAKISKEIVLSPDLLGKMSIERKRSLVADRIEVFTTLKENNGKAAKEIEELAEEKIHREIIRFSNNYYNLEKDT